MAEFLLELLSEEIPARMQVSARHELEARITTLLEKTSVHYEFVNVYSTPRRLVIVIDDLDLESDVEVETEKGPRVDAPQQAIDKFMEKWGIDSVDDLIIEEINKKQYYIVRMELNTRPTDYIIRYNLPDIIRNFSWPKSMLWGDGDFRWARPLHSILALFDGKPIDFEVGGITAGNTTRLALNDSKPIKINSLKDYYDKLDKAGIILDQATRQSKILGDALKICKKEGLKLVEDKALISEISGLVESPFCIMGYIARGFTELPSEVLQTSMKTHQKFISVENYHGVSYFIAVADKHKPSKSVQETILDGNQRVLNARLMDAVFFWNNDYRVAEEGMKAWTESLDKMTFHRKLGTQGDRIRRIASFARSNAEAFEVDSHNAEMTAKLMKLDLCSDMVGEFPELQGIMGRYYTKLAKHHSDIAQACEEHYAPLGLKDKTPTKPISRALAIADKLDTLAGFWTIGETPTSSKDPFALRRAALGVIRLILDNKLRLSLPTLLVSAFYGFIRLKPEPKAQKDLLAFFQDRLKIYLREKEDIQPDTIDACLLGELPDDLTFLYNRARALQDFRQTPECENLLQGFKRAHNILNAEQTKDGVFYEMPAEKQYFQDPCENTLFTALESAEKDLLKHLKAEQFVEMLRVLADLRKPIDTFFEAVQVNSEVEIVRRNRLCLLHKICSTMKTFADFSLLNG